MFAPLHAVKRLMEKLMGNDPKHGSLDEITKRLEEAKKGKIASEHFAEPDTKTTLDKSGLRQAMRIMVDFISSVLGGLGIGYIIDTYADTKPWGMIVMMLLGVITGFWNIFRTLSGNGYAVGFGRETDSCDTVSQEDDHNKQS